MQQSVAKRQTVALKPQFSAHLLSPGKVLVSSEKRNCVLNGALHEAVVPLLDGSLSDDEIVKKLSDRYPTTHVYYALAQLDKLGLTIVGNAELCPKAASFWSSLSLLSADQEHKTSHSSVCIKDFTDAGTSDQLVDALRLLEVDCVEEAKANLVVCIVNDYASSQLAKWSKRARKLGIPWLVAKVEGTSLWVGPFFRNEEPGCWSCLEHRLTINKGNAAIGDDVECLVKNHLGSLPTTRAMGLNLVATEVAKWFRDAKSHRLSKQLLTIDLSSLEHRLHPVLVRPDCKQCGNGGVANSNRLEIENAAKITLTPRTKAFTDDGGHRSRHPRDTVKCLERFVSPLTGIFPDLVRADVAEKITVFHLPDFGPMLERGYRLTAAGKGQSEAQAKASCLAEAMERYSCLYRTSDPQFKASYIQLKDRAVNPSALTQYSDKQVAELNQIGIPFAPLDEKQEINWTPTWSATKERICWLPTGFCYFSYPFETEKPYARIDSNGCAAGNNFEEAALQGFLELIERDALSMWWYNRVQRPGIDLASFNDRFFNEMIETYEKMGRKLTAIDLTNDVGIPVVVAVGWNNDGSKMLLGAGAHLDPRLAISRAISEINQMMPLLTAQSADLDEEFNPSIKARPHRHKLRQWLETETTESQPFFVPDANCTFTAADMMSSNHCDVVDDIKQCQDAVEKLGLEVLMLDITRPELDFSVARVTVPGLRNLHGLAAGRLYEVPAKLGWMKNALTEEELNPYPFLW